jgi:hypothetical protein
MSAGILTGCVAPDEAADAGCPNDPPRCRANTLLTCDDAGVTGETPCGADRCASDSPRPRCVPAGALPCAPDDPPACSNGLLAACDPASEYPTTRDCGAGQVCVERDGLGACAPVDEVPCDPEGSTPLCVGGRRVECDPDTRRLREGGVC